MYCECECNCTLPLPPFGENQGERLCKQCRELNQHCLHDFSYTLHGVRRCTCGRVWCVVHKVCCIHCSCSSGKAEEGQRALRALLEREEHAKQLCRRCKDGVARQPGVVGNATLVHFNGDDVTPCLAAELFRDRT